MSIEFKKTRLGVNVATDSQDNDYVMCDDNKSVYINGNEFLYSDLQALIDLAKLIEHTDECIPEDIGFKMVPMVAPSGKIFKVGHKERS